MVPYVFRRSLVTIACLVLSSGSRAQSLSNATVLCRSAINVAEAEQRIPDAFLAAIAKVESGRSMDGMVVAWPWTINAEGVGSFYASKEDAIAAVKALQLRGVRSIDIGCMQVNLQQHPEAFHSLDQAFDPPTNARFAAGLLLSLFGQTGSWPLAAAAYHSQTPTIGAAYQRQVIAAWAEPDRPSAATKILQSSGSARRADPASNGASEAAAQPAAMASFGRQGASFTGEQPRPGIVHGSGRGLDAYRMMPTRLALRLPGGSR
jgi:hypothetical protein